MFSGRNGVQNTSFALIDPQGKKLTRGARTPKTLYESPEAFAAALDATAAKYTAAKDIAALPLVRNLRLALNVAAADMRPLIVVRGEDKKDAESLAKKMATLSWKKALVGRSHYVLLSKEESFEGLTPPLGISLIQPDPYGLGGRVLVKFPLEASTKSLEAGLAQAIDQYSVDARGHTDHVREARRKGIDWESAIPVTDSKSERKSRR